MINTNTTKLTVDMFYISLYCCAIQNKNINKISKFEYIVIKSILNCNCKNTTYLKRAYSNEICTPTSRPHRTAELDTCAFVLSLHFANSIILKLLFWISVTVQLYRIVILGHRLEM